MDYKTTWKYPGAYWLQAYRNVLRFRLIFKALMGLSTMTADSFSLPVSWCSSARCGPILMGHFFNVLCIIACIALYYYMHGRLYASLDHSELKLWIVFVCAYTYRPRKSWVALKRFLKSWTWNYKTSFQCCGTGETVPPHRNITESYLWLKDLMCNPL